MRGAGVSSTKPCNPTTNSSSSKPLSLPILKGGPGRSPRAGRKSLLTGTTSFLDERGLSPDNTPADQQGMARRLRDQRKRRKAIELLLLGTKPKVVAETIGVSAPTIYSWLNSTPFKQEIMERRDHELKAIEAQVIQASQVALVTLIGACQNAVEERDRIKAAEIIITKVFDLRPEACKKALVEVQNHQHLDLSTLSGEDLHRLLTETKTIETKVVESEKD